MEQDHERVRIVRLVRGRQEGADGHVLQGGEAGCVEAFFRASFPGQGTTLHNGGDLNEDGGWIVRRNGCNMNPEASPDSKRPPRKTTQEFACDRGKLWSRGKFTSAKKGCQQSTFPKLYKIGTNWCKSVRNAPTGRAAPSYERASGCEVGGNVPSVRQRSWEAATKFFGRGASLKTRKPSPYGRGWSWTALQASRIVGLLSSGLKARPALAQSVRAGYRGGPEGYQQPRHPV